MAQDGINDNFNAQRAVNLQSSDSGDVSDIVRSATPMPFFQVAVVVDVFTDPTMLTKEDRDALIGDPENPGVANPEMVNRMSRGSILARIISRNIDHQDNRPMIFLPAWSHDHHPLKPSEQVFIFFPDPYRSQRYGYWFGRVPEIAQVEDLNFTHGDRRYDQNVIRTTAERAAGPDQEPPGFPNGNGNIDSYTLQEKDDYETIVNEAKAKELVTKEPVPRFSPRPGDRVLQGSNNARIVLGQDRTGPATEPPRPFSGTIDLVAGVGADVPEDDATPEGSAPLTITNARGERETNKNPGKKNLKDNESEGDPDFENDKSRAYISMNANVDDDFDIEIKLVPKTEGEKPAIVLKTDQLRFLAREDLKIRVGGEDGSALVFKADGNIIVLPSDSGLIKLGGEDATKAIFVQDLASSAGGTALGNQIVSTMGGLLGIGGPHGTFATKVVVK